MLARESETDDKPDMSETPANRSVPSADDAGVLSGGPSPTAEDRGSHTGGGDDRAASEPGSTTRSHETGSSEVEVAASEAKAAAAVVPWWMVHRRLYDWVLSFAHRKHAGAALFTISFAESSFFPIPPDVLLAPLCLGNRNRAWGFALLTTIASVLGAVVGYAIGWGAWEAVDQFMYRYVPGFTEPKFQTVTEWYQAYGVWILFVAAFTPIPFKVFTIAGGVFQQMLLPFIVVSLVGRGMRFFLVAALFWWIGPKATPFIDKYFNWLCLLFVALLVGGFAMLKLLH